MAPASPNVRMRILPAPRRRLYWTCGAARRSSFSLFLTSRSQCDFKPKQTTRPAKPRANFAALGPPSQNQ